MLLVGIEHHRHRHDKVACELHDRRNVSQLRDSAQRDLAAGVVGQGSLYPAPAVALVEYVPGRPDGVGGAENNRFQHSALLLQLHTVTADELHDRIF